MKKQELRKALKDLHRELEAVESVDENAQALLREVLDDINDVLERSADDPSAEDHGSWVERLTEASHDFEEAHPGLFSGIGRLMDALSKIGV